MVANLHPEGEAAGNVELQLVAEPEARIGGPVVGAGIGHTDYGRTPDVLTLDQLVPGPTRRMFLTGCEDSQTQHDDRPSC